MPTFFSRTCHLRDDRIALWSPTGSTWLCGGTTAQIKQVYIKLNLPTENQTSVHVMSTIRRPLETFSAHNIEIETRAKEVWHPYTEKQLMSKHGVHIPHAARSTWSPDLQGNCKTMCLDTGMSFRISPWRAVCNHSTISCNR